MTLWGRSGPQRHSTRFWSSAVAPLAKVGTRMPAQPSARSRRTTPQDSGSRPAIRASPQAQARSLGATPRAGAIGIGPQIGDVFAIDVVAARHIRRQAVSEAAGD